MGKGAFEDITGFRVPSIFRSWKNGFEIDISGAISVFSQVSHSENSSRPSLFTDENTLKVAKNVADLRDLNSFQPLPGIVLNSDHSAIAIIFDFNEKLHLRKMKYTNKR